VGTGKIDSINWFTARTSSVSVQVLPQVIMVYERARQAVLAQFESVVEYFSWCPAICEGGQSGHEGNWD
jgi:hypothetical protein